MSDSATPAILITSDRTKTTVTSIDMGVTLKKIWASKCQMDTCEHYPPYTKVPLTDSGIEMFKEVIAAGWSSEWCTVDLTNNTITPLLPPDYCSPDVRRLYDTCDGTGLSVYDEKITRMLTEEELRQVLHQQSITTDKIIIDGSSGSLDALGELSAVGEYYPWLLDNLQELDLIEGENYDEFIKAEGGAEILALTILHMVEDMDNAYHKAEYMKAFDYVVSGVPAPDCNKVDTKYFDMSINDKLVELGHPEK